MFIRTIACTILASLCVLSTPADADSMQYAYQYQPRPYRYASPMRISAKKQRPQQQAAAKTTKSTKNYSQADQEAYNRAYQKAYQAEKKRFARHMVKAGMEKKRHAAEAQQRRAPAPAPAPVSFPTFMMTGLSLLKYLAL